VPERFIRDLKTKRRPDRTLLHAIIDNRESFDKSQAMNSLIELTISAAC
jgi:hypothetical protein